jgi:hypothetical protein
MAVGTSLEPDGSCLIAALLAARTVGRQRTPTRNRSYTIEFVLFSFTSPELPG